MPREKLFFLNMHVVVVVYIQEMHTGYVQICIQVCAHARGGPRSTSGDFSLLLVIFIYLLFKKRLLINKSEAYCVSQDGSKELKDPPISSQLIAGILFMLFYLNFSPNSGPQDCVAGTILTMPAPQLCSVSSSFQKMKMLAG